MKIKAIVIENQGIQSVWHPKIPEDEPLLIQLMEKYENSGCSIAGTKDELLEDIADNL